MTSARWLIVIGAALLLVGLFTAFLSSHYTSQIQGYRRLGVIVFGPEPGTPEWKETERLLGIADACFYAGLMLTALGVVLQTWGSMLTMRSSGSVVAGREKQIEPEQVAEDAGTEK